MHIPNGQLAEIDQRKLVEYLLSADHPEGRAKARFFARRGIWRARPSDLRDALLDIAVSGALVETNIGPHGTKYVVDGDVLAPAGSIMRLRTIWLVVAGDVRPRMITAYPR